MERNHSLCDSVNHKARGGGRAVAGLERNHIEQPDFPGHLSGTWPGPGASRLLSLHRCLLAASSAWFVGLISCPG